MRAVGRPRSTFFNQDIENPTSEHTMDTTNHPSIAEERIRDIAIEEQAYPVAEVECAMPPLAWAMTRVVSAQLNVICRWIEQLMSRVRCAYVSLPACDGRKSLA